MNGATTRLALAALAIFACASFALGAQVQGFSHIVHPVAFAGARQWPGAWLFNAMVFVLPGSMVFVVALRLRSVSSLATGFLQRIGATLLAISALAFAAQGLLPLDLEGIDEGASRLHASAWMAWWIAFAVGAPLSASSTGGGRIVALAAALCILVFSLFANDWMPAGVAQRIAFGAWFAWFCFAAARGVNRGAASATG